MAVDLGKQIGPLPIGAWVVVVGAGLGIAYAARNSGGSSQDPTIVSDNSSPDGVGTGPGWVAVPPPTTAPPLAAPPDTNEAWGHTAIDWLITQKYNPAQSYNAITKALAGDGTKLSVKEYALWKAALRQFGAPPIAVYVPPPGPGGHHKGGGGTGNHKPPKKGPKHVPPTKHHPKNVQHGPNHNPPLKGTKNSKKWKTNMPVGKRRQLGTVNTPDSGGKGLSLYPTFPRLKARH